MPTCIIVDGPYPDVDRYGDEIPYWTVCAAGDDGEPTGKIYTCYTHGKALALGRTMAHDRRLELVNDSCAA